MGALMGRAGPQDSLLRGLAVAATGVLVLKASSPSPWGRSLFGGVPLGWGARGVPRGQHQSKTNSIKKVGGVYQNWLPQGLTS